jgi:NitT/TauT family transport system ATP-binding protein
MTARPGRIKAEIAVPLPRPREPTVTVSPAFLDLRRDLMALIREESLKAMGGEIDVAALQGLCGNLDGRELSRAI